MPKIKTKRTKFPEGFDKVEATLDELEKEMRNAENEPTEGKSKAEIFWPIMRSKLNISK
jgi:bud site selection protein 31